MKSIKKYYQYVQQIKKNQIPHCKAIHRVIERFENDLKQSESESFPYVFIEDKADIVIAFIEKLKQFEGEFNDKLLILETWQAFIIANLFGWRLKTNTQKLRFDRCFIFVARKNGKSLLFSTLALINLLTEPGAQVVSFATKKDQAKIVLKNLTQIIRKNQDLQEVLRTYREEIRNKETAGVFKCLSKDSKTQDGLNVSFGLADEVAAMSDSYLIDVIASSQGARFNPMLVEITTAGYNFDSPGYHEYIKSKKILNGEIKDDNFFTMIYEYDKEDKWDDPKNFIKANPNLNVSVKESYLITRINDAKNSGAKRPEAMTKHCNIWLKGENQWLTPEQIKKTNQTIIIDLSKYPCFGGVDLSVSNDFTAYTKCWYIPELKKFILKHKFYIPEDTINEKFLTDSRYIFDWVEQGYITTCNGDKVNYDYLLEDIKNDFELYDLKAVGFDPSRASDIMRDIKMNIGDIAAPFSQSPTQMTPAIRRFDQEISLANIIDFDDNPVWKWMMSNVELKQLPSNYLRLQKKNNDKDSGDRIDGVISTTIALGVTIGNVYEAPLKKKYASIDYSSLI